MANLTFTELRNDLSETLNRVAYQGERVVVERRGKAVAAVIAMEDLRLLEALEDQLDVAAAERALADPENREHVSWESVKERLGL